MAGHAANPAVTLFSAGPAGAELPAPWQIRTLKTAGRSTHYSLVADDGTVVLRADAEASMASVMHPLDFDPNAFPLLAWRWKITNVLRKSDLSTRKADDAPARVYVLFDYDITKLPLIERAKVYLARTRYGKDVPAAALCYVWDGKAPVEALFSSPYTDRVRVIVVESGSAHLNQWREIRRDVVADFRASFGEEPPRIVGIALAADTDNTGEKVTTFFGDIRFLGRPQPTR